MTPNVSFLTNCDLEFIVNLMKKESKKKKTKHYGHG